MQYSGMIYHIFNYRVQGCWYRDGDIYSDEQFDHIMSALEWHLPVGIQVYHYGVPGRDHFTLDNPVICQRPVLSLDPMALVTTLPTTRLSVHDRQRRLDWPVEHRLGRFLIYRGADGWPRFCYADGERFSLITPMEVTPVSLKEALDFVRQYHRHCSPPQGNKFSVGLSVADGTRIGVAIASIPKARALNDGCTLEINRVCCDPAYHNAASKLCGAAVRAGRAMGYRRFVTYTLPQESGSSVRAVGFRPDGRTAARPKGWNCRSRPQVIPEKYPDGEKIRWLLI